MNNEENNKNENTTELGKVGSQNMEAKTEYKKLKATKKPAKHPMADAVASVFNRCNGDTNCIAAIQRMQSTLCVSYVFCVNFVCDLP